MEQLEPSSGGHNPGEYNLSSVDIPYSVSRMWQTKVAIYSDPNHFSKPLPLSPICRSQPGEGSCSLIQCPTLQELLTYWCLSASVLLLINLLFIFRSHSALRSVFIFSLTHHTWWEKAASVTTFSLENLFKNNLEATRKNKQTVMWTHLMEIVKSVKIMLIIADFYAKNVSIPTAITTCNTKASLGKHTWLHVKQIPSLQSYICYIPPQVPRPWGLAFEQALARRSPTSHNLLANSDFELHSRLCPSPYRSYLSSRRVSLPHLLTATATHCGQVEGGAGSTLQQITELCAVHNKGELFSLF